MSFQKFDTILPYLALFPALEDYGINLAIIEMSKKACLLSFDIKLDGSFL